NDFINNYCHYGYSKENEDSEEELFDFYDKSWAPYCRVIEMPPRMINSILWNHYGNSLVNYPLFKDKYNYKEITCQKEYPRVIESGSQGRLWDCIYKKFPKVENSVVSKHQEILNDKSDHFKHFITTFNEISEDYLFKNRIWASIHYGKSEINGCFSSFEKTINAGKRNLKNGLSVISRFLSDNRLYGLCIIWDYN
ncbi:hypothetical protein BB560_005940, partial [Smittium megazygosporum]